MYLIIPAVWFVVVADIVFFDAALRKALPSSPEQLFWFTVFFVLPHILASQFSFYDRDYLRAYRKQLLYGVPLLLVAAAAISRFDAGSGGMIFIAVTMWHVIAQQTGIAGLLAGRTTTAFLWWKWLTVILFTFGVTLILGPWMNWVGAPMLGLTTLLTVTAVQQARHPVGRHYLWATQAMSISAALLSAGGYVFFSILIPRVVHDITAWVFYLTHDHNRNRATLHNGLYRLFRFSRLPTGVIVVSLAVAVNLIFEQGLGSWYHAIIIPISLFHYYSESFMWKRNSIHRRQVRFAMSTR